MTSRRLAPLTLLIAAAAAPAWAGKAHEHGVAKLDVVFEGTKLAISLDTPLDNLLGFERAPRTDAERRAADQAVALMKAPDKVFRIDAAAGCKPGSVDLQSEALKLGTAKPSAQAGHADLEASYEFSCTAAPARIDVLLFDAFKGFKRIEVQAVAPKGQRKVVLRRPATAIELPR